MAIRERRVRRPFRRMTGHHVRVHGAEERPERVGEALDVTSR